jgi:hypothetical protein
MRHLIHGSAITQAAGTATPQEIIMFNSATQGNASVSSKMINAAGANLWSTTRATLCTTTELTEQMLEDVISMLARISPV